MEGSSKEFLQYLTDHLKSYEGNSSLTLTKLSRTSGCEKGVNFMSEITRLSVEGTLGSSRGGVYKKSFIMKQPLTDLVLNKNFQAKEAFMNELLVYETLLPLIKDQDYAIWPKLIAANEQYLILEDLIEQGFRMANINKNGLDLDHCNLVVKNIARFHAKSVFLKLTDRTKFDNSRKHLRHIVFSENGRKYFSEMLEVSVTRALHSYQHRIGYASKKIVNTLERLKGKIYNLMYAMTEPNDVLGVICHGDLWVNNLMFKYDDQGKLGEIHFLDFQATSFAHPGTDLLRFFYTSTSSYIRKNHLEGLLQLYHKTIIEVITNSLYLQENAKFSQKFIEDFGNYDNFLKEFHKRSLYGLITAFWLLPVTTLDPNNKLKMKTELNQKENTDLSTQINEGNDSIVGVDFSDKDNMPEIVCNEEYHDKVQELMEEFSENVWLDEVETNFDNR